MQFVECHPGFAGYVQAVGVILTVAIALFGPPLKALYDRWQVRREQREAADRVARAFLAQAEKILTHIDEGVEKISSANPHNWRIVVSQVGIDVPTQFEADYLAEDGSVDVARLCYIQRFLEALGKWNLSLSPLRFATRPIGPTELSDAKVDLLARLVELRAQAADVRYTIFGLG
jgi:hypothetical protein